MIFPAGRIIISTAGEGVTSAVVVSVGVGVFVTVDEVVPVAAVAAVEGLFGVVEEETHVV
jgi:hypothetical protein